MIRQLKKDDLPRMLDVVQKDILQNPYFWIDSVSFGAQSAKTDIWAVEDTTPLGYIFRYYNSIQLFRCGVSETVEHFAALTADFLSGFDFDMISGEVHSICAINEKLDCYQCAEGVIMQQTELQYIHDCQTIRANPSDCAEIAALICSDVSIGGHYRIEALAAQLRDRMSEEKCRNYIVRVNGEIVAHFGTYAEMENIAILGGLITAPAFRGAGFGTALQAVLANKMLKENKVPLLYCFDRRIQQWYENKGWQSVRRCAKLEKREDQRSA